MQRLQEKGEVKLNPGQVGGSKELGCEGQGRRKDCRRQQDKRRSQESRSLCRAEAQEPGSSSHALLTPLFSDHHPKTEENKQLDKLMSQQPAGSQLPKPGPETAIHSLEGLQCPFQSITKVRRS